MQVGGVEICGDFFENAKFSSWPNSTIAERRSILMVCWVLGVGPLPKNGLNSNSSEMPLFGRFSQAEAFNQSDGASNYY